MLKLAIVLCTVLFASAVNASLWAGALKNGQVTATEIIDGTISKVSLKLETTRDEFKKKLQITLDESNAFCNTILMKIMEIRKNVSIETSHVANDVDISNCIKLSDELHDIARSVVSNISGCVDNKLIIKIEQIEVINNVTKNVLRKLNKFKEDVQRCGDNIVIKREPVQAAIACANAAAARASILSNKAIAELDNGEIDELLRLHTIFIECTETSGYYPLYVKTKTAEYCRATRLAEEHLRKSIKTAMY